LRGSESTSKVAAISTGSPCTHELVRYPNPSIRIAKNTGVSCYVNCVLSCLFSVPAVRTMILQAQNDIETKLNHIIAYNLSNRKTGHGNKKLELLKSFTILALHYCKISLSGTTTTTTVYIYIYIYIRRMASLLDQFFLHRTTLALRR
jgi:ubiquitin C-terminal hydrolase